MSVPTTRMTAEVPLEVKQRLESLARTTDQSEARLATEAISSYVLSTPR